MTTSLREEIYGQLNLLSGESKDNLLFYTNEILKLIEKRIDSRLAELKNGMEDEKLKNILPEEKWKRYCEKLEQSFDELEMLKMEMLK